MSHMKSAIYSALISVVPTITLADNESHWYASLNAGANFMADESANFSGAGPNRSGEVDLGVGLLSGAAVGRAFGRNFRAEAEFLYQAIDHSGIGLSNGATLPEGNFASTSVALNGLYSFNLFGRENVRTYVGVGVARLTEIDIDFEQGGREVSYSGEDWGVQFLLGARYELGERWFVDAGLRHLNAGQVTMDGEGGTVGSVRADYEPWSASFGIGLRF